MTTYLSLDVLELQSNARDEPSDGISRSLAIFDPGPGPMDVNARDDASQVSHQYQWTCWTRAMIRTMEDWLLARRGRAIPFWIPSWRQDLELVQDVGAVDSQITIRWIGYSVFYYGTTNVRRHLMFWTPGARYYRKITSAVDNGDGTETLGISSALGVTFGKATPLSFLLYCRLDSDEVEISYANDSVAECTLPYVEIPEEAP